MAASSLRIQLRGDVQGRGFPAIIVPLARKMKLAGAMAHERTGILVEVTGQITSIRSFNDSLSRLLPAETVIEHPEEPLLLPQTTPFEFLGLSTTTGMPASPLPLAVPVPRDRSLCSDCRDELFRRQIRRNHHPLIDCGRCGPRYSIIRTMPLIRTGTSMDAFEPCGQCRFEHQSDEDRRFGVEGISCVRCGPQVWLEDATGKVLCKGDEAIRQAAGAIRGNRIVAIRGTGSYSLFCDATSGSALRRLRRIKGCGDRPLPVLARHLQQVELMATVGSQDRVVLESPVNPIVLLPIREDYGFPGALVREIGILGVRLPANGIEELLVRESGWPMAFTSANRTGEPVEYQLDSARPHWADLADLVLQHDLEIVQPIEDSIQRVIGGQTTTLRLGRGTAPLPIPLKAARDLIATGHRMDQCIAVASRQQAAIGPRVGSVESTDGEDRSKQQGRRLVDLYGLSAPEVVRDDNDSPLTEQGQPDPFEPTVHAIDVRLAQALSGLVDHQLVGREAIVALWDRQSLRKWSPGSASGIFRVGRELEVIPWLSLRPSLVVGGSIGTIEPWRYAIGMLHQVACSANDLNRLLDGISQQDLDTTLQRLEESSGGVQSSGFGMLIDAVACLAGGRTRVDFSRSGMLWLESIAASGIYEDYPFTIAGDELVELDWRPMIHAIMEDRLAGVEPGRISTKFHRTLAGIVCHLAEDCPGLPIILRGQYFENRLLIELIADRVSHADRLFPPRRIPPGHGGVAAGQLAAAIHRQTDSVFDMQQLDT